METNNQRNVAEEMDRQGIIVYSSFAIIIYVLALSYCMVTNHYFEAGLVGVVMLGLGALVYWIFKSP